MGRPRLSPLTLPPLPAPPRDRATHYDHPISVGCEVAAAVVGISERSVRTEISAGRLPARKFGTRVLILWCDLETFVDCLPPFESDQVRRIA